MRVWVVRCRWCYEAAGYIVWRWQYALDMQVKELSCVGMPNSIANTTPEYIKLSLGSPDSVLSFTWNTEQSLILLFLPPPPRLISVHQPDANLGNKDHIMADLQYCCHVTENTNLLNGHLFYLPVFCFLGLTSCCSVHSDSLLCLGCGTSF